MDPVLSILPEPQALLWSRLGDIPEQFVLYEGTALTLRLGQRQSVDFDFFAADEFAAAGLLNDLGWLGRLDVVDMGDNTLVVIEPGGVQLAFIGSLRYQAVAEQSLVSDNGLVIASVFDLAATKAKAVLDRSEWRDYVDIAMLIENGHDLADIIGYATTVFDRLFAFPAPVFLRNLIWFRDGTAPDVPDGVRRLLEAAVRKTGLRTSPSSSPSARPSRHSAPGPYCRAGRPPRPAVRDVRDSSEADGLSRRVSPESHGLTALRRCARTPAGLRRAFWPDGSGRATRRVPPARGGAWAPWQRRASL